MKTAGEILSKSALYRQKLKSPEWAKFSKAFRTARRNACAVCRRTEKDTHVHHLFYRDGLQPWEHEFNDCVLLCWDCHGQMHDCLNEFRKHVFRKLNPNTFRILNGALAVGLEGDPVKFVHACAAAAESTRPRYTIDSIP